MQETTLDLAAFIENELKPLRLPTFVETAREEKIAWRAYGFGAWRRGELHFRECVRNLLPGRFKSAALQHKLQGCLDREIDGIFRRAGLYEKSTALFGRPFSAAGGSAFKNWLTAIRLINEVILEDEYRAKGRIAKDSIVIDAGANVGVFSVFAASAAPQGKVYAFEPAQTTFRTLENNLRPYPNAVAMQSALGDRVGSAELLIESSSGEGNSLAQSGLSGSYIGKEIVPVTTVDTFVREHGLPRVDFIKMDTEGFEKEILEGAAETIKKYRPERLQALIRSYVPEYRFELKRSPELDLICDR